MMLVNFLLILCAVTLTGVSGQEFKGFFVQARIVADDSTCVGSFAVGFGVADAGNSRLSSCTVNTVRLNFVTLFLLSYDR